MWWPLIGDVHVKLPKPFVEAEASQVRVALEWTTNKSPFFTRGKRSEAKSDQPSLINQQGQDHVN